MKTALATLLLLGCALSTARAQSSPQPTFEVASIRLSPPPEPNHARPAGRGIVTTDPSLLSIKYVTLKSLLMRAYGLQEFQVSGPDWLSTEDYDLTAKLPAGTTQDQIPTMLQQLVIKRFQMTLRWDTEQQTTYALVLNKGGPKFAPSADQTPHDGDLPDKARSVELPTGGPIKMNGAPITALTSVLSTALAEPVNDSTGLQGRYDITLNLAIGDLMAVHQAPSASDGGGYTPNSIFDAVRDLGLRLVPQKAEVKHLTVVKADRIPTEN